MELIESLIEDCDVYDTKEDYSYKVDFPTIIEIIYKVGYVYKDERNIVKEKYNNIVQAIYRKNMAF